MKVLIVKTSSLGDIIQSFGVLDYLHNKFPGVEVDWVVESSLQSIVSAHPLVHKAIPVDTKSIRKKWSGIVAAIKTLREQQYDLLFDLQKNSKSGLISALCRSPVKVGFGFKTVREWPNLFATNKRFNPEPNINIRLQYVGLLQKYFNDTEGFKPMGIRFNSSADDQETVSSILGAPGPLKVMVCPGSRWPNKQLPSEAMASFLVQIQENFGADYYLMWGDLNEKQYCLELQQKVSGIVVDRLSVPAWQNLMSEMDLVIAVDSAALHLCGTTGTPSFSLFGPTSPSIFKPLGAMHLAVQGDCPYNKSFEKACPLLRTCSTGACIRNLTPDWIFGRFSSWWTSKIIARR